MGDRNMLCTHQLLGAEIEHSHSHISLCPGITLANRVDFPNPSMHPVMPLSGNTANINLYQPSDHHDGGAFYGSQHHHHHQQLPILNLDLGSVGPPNFYNMVSSSSSRVLSIPMTNESANQILSSSNESVMGVNVDEYGRSHHFFDNLRGDYKRKNAEAEVALGNCYHAGTPESSSSSLNLSLNSGLQNWNKSSEAEVNMLNTTSFTPPEFSGGLLLLTDGSYRSVRSRPDVGGLQMESTVLHHHSHIFQGNYISPSFQPACSARMDQFGSNISDGGRSAWNYAPEIPYLQGRSFSGGPVEIGNIGSQGQLESSFSRNSAFFFHPPPLHNQHQHLPPAQGMHGQSYSHHPQVQAPSYGHPVNTILHHGITNPLRDVSISRIPRPFPASAAERIHRSHRRLPQAVPHSDGRMRILSQEDVVVLEFSGFRGVGNFFDQHRDMRLDIDSMSYEELLALEEKIGDVNTGLPEESILKNLKTRIYSSTESSLSDQSPNIDSEDGTCIICQMEYEQNERVGILDCGHNYHADCIKQWLLVKNLCPICKTSALASDRT